MRLIDQPVRHSVGGREAPLGGSSALASARLPSEGPDDPLVPVDDHLHISHLLLLPIGGEPPELFDDGLPALEGTRLWPALWPAEAGVRVPEMGEAIPIGGLEPLIRLQEELDVLLRHAHPPRPAASRASLGVPYSSSRLISPSSIV